MRLQATPRFFDDARLVSIKFVQHLLRHNQFDLAAFNQIFERADDGLFAVVLRKVQPDAGIDEKSGCHAFLSRYKYGEF